MGETRSRKKAKKTSRGGRGGRPQLDEAERRTGRINVPLNGEEKTLILEKAQAYNMTGALFLRELGLGHRMRRPLPAVNVEAYRELGRMGINLNRAIALANEGKPIVLNPEFLGRLYELLQSTRRALLGVTDGDREDGQGAELRGPAGLPLQGEGPGAGTTSP